MKTAELNQEKIVAAANALEHLLADVTFLGGCTTFLLVDESGYSGVRATEDVDIIIDVATAIEYLKFSKALRKLGFQEAQGGPICRWHFKQGDFPIILDVMPTNEKILGFSNRWYPQAIITANLVSLTEALEIKVVNSVYFLATKFEAFQGRGKGDYFNHDLEDIVFVMENRNDLILELNESTEELKHYFSGQAKQLLNDNFLNVLPGLLSNPESAQIIINNLRIMSTWGD